MATAITNDDPAPSELVSIQNQHAIQDLVNGCQQVQTMNSQSTSVGFIEVQRELLNFTFHSENGRLQVIDELVKLDGHFVVKIIRKGLFSLSKVYADSKTFEDESVNLVKLCISQYSKQIGSENGDQIASPAIIIDWTVELCDELMKESLSLPDTNPNKFLFSKCLSKLTDLYEAIIPARLIVCLTAGQNATIIEPFRGIFDALKPRIHFEAYEKLIEQTVAILNTEAKLNFMKFGSSGLPKIACLLAQWIALLNFSYATNWFALETAKHDFLVHDASYAQTLPFSDVRTYNESLIWKVGKAIASFLASSNGQFKLPCDKVRLKVFFDNSEILLRHTVPCFQLIQSEIGTNLMKEIFLLLGIKLNRDSLPGITDLDTKDCELSLSAIQKFILSPDTMQVGAMVQSIKASGQAFTIKNLNHIITSRLYQTASFNAITQALLSLPNKKQVLKVLQIWKQRFPNDISYHVLSEVFMLVSTVVQLKRESDMEKLITFLSQLSNEFLYTLPVWRPLAEQLIASLPHSWDSPRCLNFIRMFADKSNHRRHGDGTTEKLLVIHGFVKSLKDVSKSEEIKTKALKLGLDLFDDVQQSNEYAFVLNVILSTASDMKTKHIRKYTLDLLKAVRVHNSRIQYLPMIWNVIKSIDDSCCMERKNEVFEHYLKLLQEVGEDDIGFVIQACRDFLQFSVNTDSTKRFFAHAARGRRNRTCEFILRCLYSNKEILSEDRVNDHINLLLNIADKTLSSSKERCELFFTTVQNYMQLQILSFSSIDVFELILAATAGSIAVGTFDSNLNEPILKVLRVAVHTHQRDGPVVFLFLYIYLTQTFRRCLGKSEDYLKLFAEGLCLIARLPLKLQQIKCLIHKVTTILDQERITNEQEMWNIVFHLFKIGNGSTSAIESNDLELHFKKLLKPLILRNVAQINPVIRRKEHIVAKGVKGDPSFSLFELLVERMPKTFANGTSADLFRFIVKRTEQNCLISSFILPVAEAIVKENVSEEELKTEIEEIEEILLRIPPHCVPLIGECMRECHIVGFSEEKKIKVLILQVIEIFKHWKWNVDDTSRMLGSILNIPKQLVLVFKEATNTREAVNKGMERIFEAVSKLDPLILTGECLLKFGGLQDRLGELIQHDFNMLLTRTSLKIFDVCSVLDFYRSLNLEDLLYVLALSREGDMRSYNASTYWSSKYNRFEVLTPGNLAYLVLNQLRRLEISDVRNKTFIICCQLLNNHSLNQLVPCGCPLKTTLEEYIEFFITVINKSTHLAEIEHWLTYLNHYAVQCKDVIMAACSWKAGNKSCEEALRMNDQVSKTLIKLLRKQQTSGSLVSSCYATLSRELDAMALVTKTTEDEELAYKLFELICISRHSTEACLTVVPSWSREESLLFVDAMKDLYGKRNKEVKPEQVDSEMVIPLQILPFAAKAFPNSAINIVNFLTTITEKCGGPDDPLSLGRIPVWYKQMTDAGYPSQVIESWCTSLVHSQNLCSTDVDAITNMTPETIKLLTKETDEIGKCLFLLDASESLKTDKESFKRCLLLARLLNEFASIAGQLKENLKVVQRIKDGALALCSSFLDDTSLMGNLYKIRYNILKELFVLLFGGENGEHTEPLTDLVTTPGPLSKSLVILFRRLARSVISRPITFGHVKSIIHAMLNHNVKPPRWQYQEIQVAIHEEVLNFGTNQDAMHTLEVSGYNQSTARKDDLWYSSSIQMSAYVTTIESFESSRTESLLRQLWREWRTILSVHDISEVKVNGEILKTAGLFKWSDSLEIMESQLQSVKQATHVQSLLQNDWSNYRRMQLLRNERRLRERIEEQANQVKQMTESKLTKMVIVWENQLLASVKTCSEKIPDCYAPNGFHSEKPVICGITVDNRILTLYKEEKGGSRTEMENVEVKLFPVGMFVFGMFSSSHPYDTEQLWAAFFKMLLDKHLVPKIFLSNVSPAFEWIKKFVTPETSLPRLSFLSCCNLIPSSEDSFDYDPDLEIQCLHTVLAGSQMKELIILTPEKAKRLEINNIKPPNRNKLIREQMDKVVLHLKKDSCRLQEIHPQSHDKILARLKFAIRKAVEFSVDGNEPTKESISNNIDMKKLLFGCQDAQQHSKDAYAAVILDAMKTVAGESLQSSQKSYDGCEHVVFLQQHE